MSRGIECLGYGQLFQWTGSVASRGKLAGESSAALLYDTRAEDEGKSHDAETPVDLPEEHVGSQQAETEAGPSHPGDDDFGGSTVVPDAQLIIRDDVSMARGLTVPPTLIDPLYQDMSHSHRRYLDYCMCQRTLFC